MRTKSELSTLAYTANQYGMAPGSVLSNEEQYELALVEENERTEFLDKPSFPSKEQRELNEKNFIAPLEDLSTVTWRDIMKAKKHIIPVLTGDDDQKKFNLFNKGGMGRFWASYKLATKHLNARKREEKTHLENEIKQMRDFFNVKEIRAQIANASFLTKKDRNELNLLIEEFVEVGYIL